MKRILASLFALLVSVNAFGQADYLSPNGMTEIMSGADDATAHISLGHTFPYYGGVFTDAWMSSNGFILLYDPVSQYGNSQTWNQGCCSGFNPTGTQGFSFMLAPLWTDLRDANATPDAGYYYETNSDESKFLWYNVNEYATQNTNTFQVNLWPDGSFDFIYDEVDITKHSTWIGFTGDTSNPAEVNELKYAQDGIDEFGLDFVSTTFQGGRAWYGQDGGYAATGPDCSNALNDSSCPGYEEAYYSQQCSNDPFYDNQCPGYEQAYFDQQCSYDDLYDQMCPGYDNAIIVQNASGTDFIFGDDISDFYDTEPMIDETDMFLSTMEETDMFLSTMEETYMFTENTDMYTEVYTEEINEPFFEEPPPPQERAPEEEPINESIQQEYVQVTQEINREEEVAGNIEEELPVLPVEPPPPGNIEEEAPVEEPPPPLPPTREEPLAAESIAATSPSRVPVDAVGIALTTANKAEELAVSFAMSSSSQVESSFSSEDISNDLSEKSSIQIDVVEQTIEAAQSIASYTALQSADFVTQSSQNEDNVNYEKQSETTFGSIDSSFADSTFDMMMDPTMVVSDIEVAAVESPIEQAAQEEQTIDFQMESSTPQQDSGFAEQQNQSFSTGQSITAVLNNVAPNFSKFDVAPPSQQEQQTANKAEAQASNMSDAQLEENLEEFADNLKDSGGFGDQSMTIFLMGRVNGFANYGGQLQDTDFYTDRGMPGGRVQNDRNAMLRMMGTDNKHEELISLQYGR